MGSDVCASCEFVFEQCEIIKEDDAEAMRVDFTIQESNGEIIGKAKLLANGREYTSAFSEQLVEGDEKLTRRQLKRVHSHLFLEVLEQATDMMQSWGILTGIRPMKLYHKYRREGQTTEQAIENIMENYRVSREKVSYSQKLRMCKRKQSPIYMN